MFSGKFTNADGHEIELIITRDADREELTVTDLVVSSNGDNTDVYAPVRYSSLSFSVYTDNRELYTGGVLNSYVSLWQDGEQIWGGYIIETPQNQPFNYAQEVLTFTAVDSLTMLKSQQETRQGTMSFGAYIAECLKSDYIYIPFLSVSDSESLLDATFDVKAFLKTDDTIVYKATILEQILSYMGVSLLGETSEGYIIANPYALTQDRAAGVLVSSSSRTPYELRPQETELKHGTIAQAAVSLDWRPQLNSITLRAEYLSADDVATGGGAHDEVEWITPLMEEQTLLYNTYYSADYTDDNRRPANYPPEWAQDTQVYANTEVGLPVRYSYGLTTMDYLSQMFNYKPCQMQWNYVQLGLRKDTEYKYIAIPKVNNKFTGSALASSSRYTTGVGDLTDYYNSPLCAELRDTIATDSEMGYKQPGTGYTAALTDTINGEPLSEYGSENTYVGAVEMSFARAKKITPTAPNVGEGPGVINWLYMSYDNWDSEPGDTLTNIRTLRYTYESPDDAAMTTKTYVHCAGVTNIVPFATHPLAILNERHLVPIFTRYYDVKEPQEWSETGVLPFIITGNMELRLNYNNIVPDDYNRWWIKAVNTQVFFTWVNLTFYGESGAVLGSKLQALKWRVEADASALKWTIASTNDFGTRYDGAGAVTSVSYANDVRRIGVTWHAFPTITCRTKTIKARYGNIDQVSLNGEQYFGAGVQLYKDEYITGLVIPVTGYFLELDIKRAEPLEKTNKQGASVDAETEKQKDNSATVYYWRNDVDPVVNGEEMNITAQLVTYDNKRETVSAPKFNGTYITALNCVGYTGRQASEVYRFGQLVDQYQRPTLSVSVPVKGIFNPVSRYKYPYINEAIYVPMSFSWDARTNICSLRISEKKELTNVQEQQE